MNNSDYKKLFRQTKDGEGRAKYIGRALKTKRAIELGIPLEDGTVLQSVLSNEQIDMLGEHIDAELVAYVRQQCKKKPYGLYGHNQEDYVQNAIIILLDKLRRFDIRPSNLRKFMHFTLLDAMNKTYEDIGERKKNDVWVKNKLEVVIFEISQLKGIQENYVSAEDVYEYQREYGLHYSLDKIKRIMYEPTKVSFELYMQECDNDDNFQKKMSDAVKTYDSYFESDNDIGVVQNGFFNIISQLSDIRIATLLLKLDYIELSNSNMSIVGDDLFVAIYNNCKKTGELTGGLNVRLVENNFTAIKRIGSPVIDSLKVKGYEFDDIIKCWQVMLDEYYEPIREYLYMKYVSC